MARNEWLPIAVATLAPWRIAAPSGTHWPGAGGSCSTAGITPDRTEQRALGIFAKPAASNIGLEILFQAMVAGHLVLFAAFFVEQHPMPAALHEYILDAHLHGGPDPSVASYGFEYWENV